jgi:hypothetical protein
MQTLWLSDSLGNQNTLIQPSLIYNDIKRHVDLQLAAGYPDHRVQTSIAMHYLPHLRLRQNLFLHGGIGTGMQFTDNSDSFSEEADFYVEPVVGATLRTLPVGLNVRLFHQWLWWVSTPRFAEGEAGNIFFSDRHNLGIGLYASWNF